MRDDFIGRRGSARLAIHAPVTIRFPGVEQPHEGTVANVGMSGIFVSGPAPVPPGTLMHFEFRPSPYWHRLRGRGRVIWVRKQTNAAGEPPGMGVRFVELDDRARRGVRWLIETLQAVGDKPFDTWTVPIQFARGEPADGDALATQEIEPVPPAAASGWRRRLTWLIVAGGLVAALVGWATMGSRAPAAAPDPAPIDASRAVEPTPQVAARAVETPSGPLAEEIEDIGAAAADPQAEAPSTSEQSAVTEALTALLTEWARAWSSRDIARYLEFYAEDFTPEGGVSPAAWASRQAEEMAGPDFSPVDVEDIEVLDADGPTPRTLFKLRSEAGTPDEAVTRSLIWTRRNGIWQIAGEQSEPDQSSP